MTSSPERLKELREGAAKAVSNGWSVSYPPSTVLSLLDLIERQREALKPFAEIAEVCEQLSPNEADSVKLNVRLGDLRRARTVYEGEE